MDNDKPLEDLEFFSIAKIENSRDIVGGQGTRSGDTSISGPKLPD